MTRDDATWEVFARKAYDEPLHHVGAVTEEELQALDWHAALEQRRGEGVPELMDLHVR